MTKKQVILFTLLSLFSLQSWANSVAPYTYTVQEDGNDVTYLDVRQSKTGASFNTLNTEYNASLSKVYIPFVATATNSNYVLVDDSSELAGNTDENYIRIALKITTTSSSQFYLNAAYEDPDVSGSYITTALTKTMMAYGVIPVDADYQQFNSAVTNYTVTLYLNLRNVCEGDCQLNNDIKDFKLFFFLSPDNYVSIPNTINTADYPDGATIQFSFSDKVPAYSTTLNELRKGDGRLIANITGANIANGYKTVGLYKLSTEQNSTAYDTIPNTMTTNNYANVIYKPFGAEGDITFDGLTNGQDYSFVIALMDKYRFVTKVSNSMTQQPQSIQTFIQTQQCYLLSAGFQEEHYVIEYFKMIRDNYLLKNWVGTQFVHFYYWSAPRFTSYIYHSKVLSAFFRGFGYTLYFIFHHPFAALFGTALIPLFVFRRKLLQLAR